MSRFKPSAPKWPWRNFLTAVEADAVSEFDAVIEHRKADLANARRARASIITTATARAKAHAGRGVEND